MKKVLTIEGMKCNGCAKKIHEQLKSIDGVTEVSVSLEDKSVLIESQAEVRDDLIYQSVEGGKYKIVSIAEVKAED